MTFESKPPSIGLWRSTSDRGPHASGNCGGIRFVLWDNTDSDGNQIGNQPHYRLVLEATQKRETPEKPGSDVDNTPEPQGGGAPPDDEIPFMMEWR